MAPPPESSPTDLPGREQDRARPSSEQPPRPTVAASIVHFRAEAWCLDAVRALARSIGVHIRVCVVDNSAPSPRLRRELPRDVALIEAGSNVGYAGGANLALRHWRAESPATPWLLVASHDLLVEPDCVASLVAAGERASDFGLLGPVLGPPTPFWGGVWNGYRAWQRGGPPAGSLPGDPPATGPIEADWLSGTCLLLRGSCLEEVGEFDADLHSYGEDLDYGLRCRDRGWKVGVVPAASAHGRGSAIPERERLMAHNGVLLAAKRGGYPNAARAGGFTAGLALRLAARSLSVARTSEERAAAARRARALATGLASVEPREVRAFARKHRASTPDAPPAERVGQPSS